MGPWAQRYDIVDEADLVDGLGCLGTHGHTAPLGLVLADAQSLLGVDCKDATHAEVAKLADAQDLKS